MLKDLDIKASESLYSSLMEYSRKLTNIVREICKELSLDSSLSVLLSLRDFYEGEGEDVKHKTCGYYDPRKKRIVISLPCIAYQSSDEDRTRKFMLTLAHELIHHCQYTGSSLCKVHLSIEEGENINEVIPYDMRPHEIEAYKEEKTLATKLESSPHGQKLKKIAQEIISLYTKTHQIKLQMELQNTSKNTSIPSSQLNYVKIQGIVIEPKTLDTDLRSYVACIKGNALWIKLYTSMTYELTKPIAIILFEEIPLSILSKCNLVINPLKDIEVELQCPNHTPEPKGYVLYGLDEEGFSKLIPLQATEINTHTLHALLNLLINTVNGDVNRILKIYSNNCVVLRLKDQRLRKILWVLQDLECKKNRVNEIIISDSVLEIKLKLNSKTHLYIDHLRTLTIRELFTKPLEEIVDIVEHTCIRKEKERAEQAKITLRKLEETIEAIKKELGNI